MTPPVAPLRKVLCCLATGPAAELLAFTRPTFADYAERHGYDLVLRTEAPATGRPPAWDKVPFIREQLDAYDLVLWLDADLVITDPSRDVADDLDPDRDVGLVAHQHGPATVPNTGVVLLRSSPAARELLDRTWATDDQLHHPWWENAALVRVLGFDVSDPARTRLDRPDPLLARTQFLDGAWNDLAAAPSAAPRFLHFAGVPHEVRRTEMPRIVALATGRPLRPAATVVVVPGSAAEAWDALVALAALPDEPSFEVIVADRGTADLAPALTGVDGDLRVLPVPGATAEEAEAAAAAAAAGAAVVRLPVPPPAGDPGWLERALAVPTPR